MSNQMDRPPLHPDNKIYTLKPKFITSIQKYFRDLRLKRYKKKKIKESKTSHQRYYVVKFKIHVDDDYNPQVSDLEYEMLVSSHAAFFAKKSVEIDINRKLRLEFTGCDEIGDEEYSEFLISKEEYIKNEQNKKK